MTPISITNFIYDKIKFIQNADTRQNIFDYKNFHKIGNKGILDHTTIDITFKSQIGGSVHKLRLDDGLKYEFYLDEITPETNKLNRMCFMSNSLSHDCLCILYGIENSGDTTMIIESLLGDNDCVKYENQKIKIKPGDVLMQILLKLIKLDPKFAHIKKIKLSDTSKKSCYDIGIRLLYLRTICYGIPYYAKFGFRPEFNSDYEIFKHNRNNFKLNNTVCNIDLLNIIENNKNDMKINTYDTYAKNIKKYIESNQNINPILFFSELIDIVDISLGKKKMIKNNIFFQDKIINNKKIMSSICDLLNLICRDVFIKLGYRDYKSNVWVLNL